MYLVVGTVTHVSRLHTTWALRLPPTHRRYGGGFWERTRLLLRRHPRRQTLVLVPTTTVTERLRFRASGVSQIRALIQTRAESDLGIWWQNSRWISEHLTGWLVNQLGVTVDRSRGKARVALLFTTWQELMRGTERGSSGLTAKIRLQIHQISFVSTHVVSTNDPELNTALITVIVLARIQLVRTNTSALFQILLISTCIVN